MNYKRGPDGKVPLSVLVREREKLEKMNRNNNKKGYPKVNITNIEVEVESPNTK